MPFRNCVCSQMGCTLRALLGKKYCEKHLHANDETDRQASPHRELYGKAAWNGPHGLRQFILQRDPICKACHREWSTDADHIRDHNGDWQLFFDRENCQGLCHACHSMKTAKEHGVGGVHPWV
jgi:5-methylcytosine-specific restriction enzyme A